MSIFVVPSLFSTKTSSRVKSTPFLILRVGHKGLQSQESLSWGSPTVLNPLL